MSNVINISDNKEFTPVNNDIAAYPSVLRAKHIAQYLDISIAMAYNLLNSKGFPKWDIKNSKRVSKEAFIRFLKENEGGQLLQE